MWLAFLFTESNNRKPGPPIYWWLRKVPKYLDTCFAAPPHVLATALLGLRPTAEDPTSPSLFSPTQHGTRPATPSRPLTPSAFPNTFLFLSATRHCIGRTWCQHGIVSGGLAAPFAPLPRCLTPPIERALYRIQLPTTDNGSAATESDSSLSFRTQTEAHMPRTNSMLPIPTPITSLILPSATQKAFARRWRAGIAPVVRNGKDTNSRTCSLPAIGLVIPSSPINKTALY